MICLIMFIIYFVFKMSMKRKFSAASAVSQYYGAKRHRALVKPVYRRAQPKKESGYVDTVAANYPLDSTGSVTLLNTVPNNTTVSSRVGKKILGKGLQMRGNIRNGSTATTNDIAYMIVYDKRPTGSLPTVNTILVSASPHALNNDANAGRFRILFRHDNVLSGETTTAVNSACIKSADNYVVMKDLPTVYKALGTGAIDDIEEGALYLVTVGNVVAGTAAATLTAGFRYRFVDQ